MKDTSKVILGATLVLVVTLAFVLGLILILVAELYCSLLIRRRRRLRAAAATITTAAANAGEVTTVPSSSSSQGHSSSSSSSNHNPSNPSPTTPLGSFYAQGVLQAPRSLLFPAVSFAEDRLDAKKQQLSELHHHHVVDIPTRPPPPPPTPPSPPLVALSASPKPFKVELSEEVESIELEPANFVYISNPIYENPENRSISCASTRPNTPFETPDTSPSRLEEMDGSGSSGDDDDDDEVAPLTPPLTPMKKLPEEASSVSLRDARSLPTNSGTDTNSVNGLSSSSSGSPCTSPSW